MPGGTMANQVPTTSSEPPRYSSQLTRTVPRAIWLWQAGCRSYRHEFGIVSLNQPPKLSTKLQGRTSLHLRLLLPSFIVSGLVDSHIEQRRERRLSSAWECDHAGRTWRSYRP